MKKFGLAALDGETARPKKTKTMNRPYHKSTRTQYPEFLGVPLHVALEFHARSARKPKAPSPFRAEYRPNRSPSRFTPFAESDLRSAGGKPPLQRVSTTSSLLSFGGSVAHDRAMLESNPVRRGCTSAGGLVCPLQPQSQKLPHRPRARGLRVGARAEGGREAERSAFHLSRTDN